MNVSRVSRARALFAGCTFYGAFLAFLEHAGAMMSPRLRSAIFTRFEVFLVAVVEENVREHTGREMCLGHTLDFQLFAKLCKWNTKDTFLWFEVEYLTCSN